MKCLQYFNPWREPSHSFVILTGRLKRLCFLDVLSVNCRSLATNCRVASSHHFQTKPRVKAWQYVLTVLPVWLKKNADYVCTTYRKVSTFMTSVYIYLYSPTVDNTFLCLFCSTRFCDYTTIIIASTCSQHSSLVYLPCRLFTYNTISCCIYLGIKS
jgi:hypothetical protein